MTISRGETMTRQLRVKERREFKKKKKTTKKIKNSKKNKRNGLLLLSLKRFSLLGFFFVIFFNLFLFLNRAITFKSVVQDIVIGRNEFCIIHLIGNSRLKVIQSVNKPSIFGSLTNKAKKCNHLYTVN